MRRPTDPLPAFRFVLELGFLPVGGFSECTGLQSETKLHEIQEGGRTTPLKFPSGGSIANVVLKRGIVLGPQSNLLFEWHRDVVQGRFDASGSANRRPSDVDADIDRRISIVLGDDAGLPVKRFTLFRALPVKWSGPELKAQASEVAIEVLELACEGIEVS